MTLYQIVNLYILERGNKFEVWDTNNRHKVTEWEFEIIHPELIKAIECKTHEAALTFLQNLKLDKSALRSIESYYIKIPEFDSFKLVNTSLIELISYVESKIINSMQDQPIIVEKQKYQYSLNTPESIFCQIL